MPFSDQARTALETAVRLNPGGAQVLLTTLVAAPRAVRYKATDRLGPLAHMLRPRAPWTDRSPGAGSLTRPELPPELVDAADAFTREWLERRFTKAELAAEVTRILESIGVEVEAGGLDPTSGWRTVASLGATSSDALDAFFPPPRRRR